MTGFRLTAVAEEDLLSIWEYIAQDNPNAATRQLRRIEDHFKLLADNPRPGPARPDIAEDMRFFPVGSYLILYRLDGHGIDVVRVLHGARNIGALFDGEL